MDSKGLKKVTKYAQPGMLSCDTRLHPVTQDFVQVFRIAAVELFVNSIVEIVLHEGLVPLPKR